MVLHLSEDIFCGLDWALRDVGREIIHAEYMSLARRARPGLQPQVMVFFQKLSAGEQLLTRQKMWLQAILPLPEALPSFYAHGGLYIGNLFIAKSGRLLFGVA